MNEFYVYGYFEPGNGEPFYIGKGKGDRAWVHLNPSVYKKKSRFYNKLRKLLDSDQKPDITLIQQGLSEDAAFTLECDLIQRYGRLDLTTGCLTNHTDGGEGQTGAIRSEASCLKQASSMLGKNRNLSDSERERRSKMMRDNNPGGWIRSPEDLANLSRNRKDKKVTGPALTRLRDRCGKGVISLCPLTNVVIKQYECMNDARLDGFNVSNITACCKGRRKEHGGLIWEYS